MGLVIPTTRAQVNLEAIASNMRAIRTRVGDRLVLAAVKADSYGHGALEISRFLEQEGLADWLGVATTGEGVELREGGVHLPILKLSQALPDELDADLGAGITLPVMDATTIDQLAARAHAVRPGEKVAVHLKVDTGMRRIGCRPEQAVEMAHRVDDAGLDLQGIFTHLPVSDTPQGADFTHRQLRLFRDTVAAVEQARGKIPLIHSSNSAAVLWQDLTGMTMVRPGVIVYGYYPDPQTPHSIELRPSMELRSRVMYIKQIHAGESVGYGRTWLASQDTWIATVPIGYGDGYSRSLSNRGRIVIGGRPYPVVGRVCMDQVMVDLGPVEPAVQVGDEVVVMGDEAHGGVGVEETAALMGTSPYEVTCLITKRVPRVYVTD